MLDRVLDFSIDKSSWQGRRVPTWLKSANTATMVTVDLVKALLTLGTLTTPSGLSAGSPERYWACVRYLSACTDEPHLRIRQTFLTLDPHQRGILSDDFGVALTTSWIAQQLSAREIVDGRFFALNFGSGARRAGRAMNRIPKIGSGKCPDYVIKDSQGRFHVLECKGTQSAGYLRGALIQGQRQKHSITFGPKIDGQKLVAGLRLRGEGAARPSEIRIVDPIGTPLIRVTDGEGERAERVMRRLGAARMLNLAGFTDVSSELLWKDVRGDGDLRQLFYPAELRVLASPRSERVTQARKQITSSLQLAEKQREVVQRMRIRLPYLRLDSDRMVNSVLIERGLSPSYLEAMRMAKDDIADFVEESAAPDVERISIVSRDQSATLTYGGFAWARFTFDDSPQL